MVRVYVPDIECESCVRLISRKLKEQSIREYTILEDSVEVKDTHADSAMKAIKSLGYRAATVPFDRMTLGERYRHFREHPNKYQTEVQGLMLSAWVFIILSLMFALAYNFVLRNVPGFLGNYGWWMFYLILTVTSLGFSAWHFYAYQGRVTCMTGMMIGMGFGMQAGMMLGAVVGATNGFFTGAMVGMLAGVGIGALTGRVCGTMGWVQGLMSGIMGGTMGAMITVMMLTDRVLVFMPFYMVLNIAVMLGLSLMYYEEVVEKEQVKRRPVGFAAFLAIAVIVTFVLAAIMMYGPKSPLFAF